ncbi:MAG: transporter related [Conexibacter sp.]|nr:transporter related [Conexibacter sp.]
MSALLEVDDLHAGYGAYGVLEGITLSVQPGATVAIVGPNGAGKSTLLRALSGLADRRSGAMRFAGEDLLGMRPFQRSRAGLIHVPEGRRLFPELTVEQTLRVASASGEPKVQRDGSIDRVCAMFPRLRERWRVAAGNLSGGEQQMLAIARALMALPRLLMLDEPSLGLAPKVIDEIYDTLAQLSGDGLALVIVEQNVTRSFDIAEYGYVFEGGRIALDGAADELAADPRLAGVYLQGRHAR